MREQGYSIKTQMAKRVLENARKNAEDAVVTGISLSERLCALVDASGRYRYNAVAETRNIHNRKALLKRRIDLLDTEVDTLLFIATHSVSKCKKNTIDELSLTICTMLKLLVLYSAELIEEEKK